MFLTRLGAGSKMVVNGDVTQIDLPRAGAAACATRHALFDGVHDVGVVELNETDVVRHPLVGKIITRLPEPGLIYLRNATRKQRLNLPRAQENGARATRRSR